MLCVMEGAGDGQGDATSEFIASGRTGRRNAMPDILNEHAATTTADLPEALEKLSCSGGSSLQAGSLAAPPFLHLLVSLLLRVMEIETHGDPFLFRLHSLLQSSTPVLLSLESQREKLVESFVLILG